MTKHRTKLAVAGLTLSLLGAGFTVVANPPGAVAAGATPAACTMAGTSGLSTKDANGHTTGQVDVLDTLAQVLPAHHFAGASAATLCSARNAYASFQVEVTANQGTALTNVAMTASTLVGPGGATIPGTAAGAASDIQFDREDYVTLSRLSDAELDPAATSLDTVTPAASRVSRNENTGACTDTADACRFPDVLVPDRDSLYGEARNAFQSLTVPSGEDRVAWVDVFVPTASPAGTYTGSVTVTQTNGAAATVPVTLQVVSATLPATSTMDSAFFYDSQGSNSGTDYQKAAELALDDRVSFVPDGSIGSAAVVNNVMAPLLDGTDSRVKLQDANGKRAALTDLPMSAMWDSFDVYKSLFTNATTTKPWAYCDEWGYAACATAYTNGPAKTWPGIPLLAIDAATPSSAYDPSDKWADPESQAAPSQLNGILGGVVDLQQLMDPTGGWTKLAPQYSTDTSDRSPYLRAWAAGAAGRQVWTYTSNESGSNPYSPTVARFTGFASYGIDQVASEQEATGWQSFNLGLNGELYWTVDQPTSASLNTANTGLTGDGTLVYPYNAAQVGGQDSIPLESIRLKRIRDGRQAYELLHLANAQGLKLSDGRTGRAISSALFPALSNSAVTPAALDAALQDVFRLFPAGTVKKAVNAHDLDCNGTPDFLAVQAGSGNLRFYPRTATDWTPNAPIVTGSGFGGTAATLAYAQLLLPGDLNGDGAPDLLGRKADGSLWLMAGNCTGSFGAAVKLTATATSPVSIGDFDGDGVPDLFDKHADGTLWLLHGTGTGQFAAPTQAGAGWASLQITGVGDFNGDGDIDVVARQTDGSLLLYEGNGAGGWKTVLGGLAMGLTLPQASFPTLYGVGDLSGDGAADLVAVDSAGTMWRYNGDGTNTLSSVPTRIGGGWTADNLVQVAQ